MTQSSNINSINTNTKASTTKYFNNITLPPFVVSTNVNDALIGYFEQIADNKNAARALASAVILTAVNQGIDPMETLSEFSKLSAGQLTSYTIMFLNLSRKGTSYLGINNAPIPSKYVTHMIRP